MGRYIATINKVYASYGDWSWDYIKKNQSKDYYDRETIEIDLDILGKKQIVNVQIEELVDIKLVRSKYTWEWNDKKTLHRWLYDYLKENGEKIEGYIEIRLHTGGLDYNKPEVDGYYLQSNIGDENIILSTNKKLHEIKKYEDFDWLRLRYMYLT